MSDASANDLYVRLYAKYHAETGREPIDEWQCFLIWAEEQSSPTERVSLLEELYVSEEVPMRKRRTTKDADWDTLIRLVQTKVERLRTKANQLEWLVGDFRRQAKEGKVCPLTIAKNVVDLAELLGTSKVKT